MGRVFFRRQTPGHFMMLCAWPTAFGDAAAANPGQIAGSSAFC
jgi:hypothetical protein